MESVVNFISKNKNIYLIKTKKGRSTFMIKDKIESDKSLVKSKGGYNEGKVSKKKSEHTKKC